MNKALQQNICLLGATGSIGDSTLEVIRQHRDKFTVQVVSAFSQMDKLVAICQEFQPSFVVLANADYVDAFQQKSKVLTHDFELCIGTEALATMSAHPSVDIVVSAIVGAAGLLPTLSAINADKKVLLANKESLIMAGDIMMQAVADSNAALLPIDSEHNAIFQVLSDKAWSHGLAAGGVSKIILTASGGPFREFSAEALAKVTPEQACKHPNWSMGRKISVDSATLMNKGLEVIEAFYLFKAEISQIEVVVHPQSLVHSMVEYVDGSVLAQLGQPDMKTPITYALSYPERIPLNAPKLDWRTAQNLSFMPPDYEKFPCLPLAFDALKAGGTAPALLNASNEVAVALFLANKISFNDIARLNKHVLATIVPVPQNSLADVLTADSKARAEAQAYGKKLALKEHLSDD